MAISESPFFGRRLALTTADYRLFYTERNESTELYAFRGDPLEQQDIADQHPEVTERMVSGLKGWERLMEAKRIDSVGEADIENSTLEQLKALGYLGN